MAISDEELLDRLLEGAVELLRYNGTALALRDGTWYLSTSTVAGAEAANVTRAAKVVRERMAHPKLRPVRGHGTPLDPERFDQWLCDAAEDPAELARVYRAHRKSVEPYAAQDAARDALLLAIKRVVAGEPSALRVRKGVLRFSSRDACEAMALDGGLFDAPTVARIGHGVSALGLWDRRAVRDSHAWARLGRPLDGHKFIAWCAREGMSGEALLELSRALRDGARAALDVAKEGAQ